MDTPKQTRTDTDLTLYKSLSSNFKGDNNKGKVEESFNPLTGRQGGFQESSGGGGANGRTHGRRDSGRDKGRQKAWVTRALKRKEPKIAELPKIILLLRGLKCSNTVKDVLDFIGKLKVPNVKKFHRKNPVLPFEDATSLEFFSEKNSAALFAMGNHSPKRPDNLILGRFFDYKMLDMVEFGVKNYKSIDEFKDGQAKPPLTSRSPIIFQGAEFENDPTFKTMQNLLLDVFSDPENAMLNLTLVDHVIIMTSRPNEVLFRHYAVLLKKSGTRIPRIELVEIGPSMDLEVRRHRFASGELRQQAMTHWSQKKSKARKNLRNDELRQELGTLHLGSQNLSEMNQKLPKALRHKKRGGAENESEEKNDDNKEYQRKRVKPNKDEEM